MNALIALLLMAGVVYGIWIDGTFWKIYGTMVAVYTVFVFMQKDKRENPMRKTLTIAQWSCK